MTIGAYLGGSLAWIHIQFFIDRGWKLNNETSIIHYSSCFFRIIYYSFKILFGSHSSLFLERNQDFSLLDSISGLIHDYTFDYRYHTIAPYYTLLPHRATYGDLFVKLSWCCIFRCYGYYYHDVFFALTATSLFRRQLHRRTYLSCSSYW